jgi:hypothetical protein
MLFHLHDVSKRYGKITALRNLVGSGQKPGHFGGGRSRWPPHVDSGGVEGRRATWTVFSEFFSKTSCNRFQEWFT